MVGAVKQKFRAARDGTECSYDQLVPVDRIVIQHIIALKLPGVMDKIVIYRVLTYGNIGVCDHIFQINGLGVSSAGVNFFLRYSHLNSSCIFYATIPAATRQRLILLPPLLSKAVIQKVETKGLLCFTRHKTGHLQSYISAITRRSR